MCDDFFELLTHLGLDERLCETASYGYDWHAGITPMRMIGMLV
jgi:hypothetical protein